MHCTLHTRCNLGNFHLKCSVVTSLYGGSCHGDTPLSVRRGCWESMRVFEKTHCWLFTQTYAVPAVVWRATSGPTRAFHSPTRRGDELTFEKQVSQSVMEAKAPQQLHTSLLSQLVTKGENTAHSLTLKDENRRELLS